MLLRPPRLRKILLFTLMCFSAATVWGDGGTNRVFAARAETEFLRAQKAFQSDTNNVTNAWRFARACFDRAGFATNETQRADVAQQGIAACKPFLERDPKSTPVNYYLAMDYGELAEAKKPSLTSYRLIWQIEREFKAANNLDEHFDYAGPSRNLGLLYRDAPGWPLSIGNRRKAREWLERAATLAPNYPENQLNLAESLLQWHQRDDAQKTLQKLDAIWPVAQTNLAGAFWEQSWDNWKTRRSAARAEFKRVFKRDP